MVSKRKRGKGRGGAHLPVLAPAPRSASDSPAQRFQPSEAYLARIGHLPAATPVPPEAAVLPPSPAPPSLAAAQAAASRKVSWGPDSAGPVVPAWEAQQQQQTPPVLYSFPQTQGTPTLPLPTSAPPLPVPSSSPPLPRGIHQPSTYSSLATSEALVEATCFPANESTFVAPFAFPPDSPPPIQPEYAEEVQVNIGSVDLDGEPAFLSPALLDLPDSFLPPAPTAVSPPSVPSNQPLERFEPPPQLELPYDPISFPSTVPYHHSPSANIYDSEDDDAESYQSEVLIQEQLVGPRSAPPSLDGDAQMDESVSASGSSSDGGETQDNELDFGSESDEDELYIEYASGREGDQGGVLGEEDSRLVVEDQSARFGREGEEDEEDLEYEMLYGAREEEVGDGRARKRRRIDSDNEEEESTAGDFSRAHSAALQEDPITGSGSGSARSRAASFESPPPAPRSLLRRAFAFATSTPNGLLPASFSASAAIERPDPEASTSGLSPSFPAHAHDAFGQGSPREGSPGAGVSPRRASQSLSPGFGPPHPLPCLPAENMALDSSSAAPDAVGDVSLGEDMEMSFADLPADWVGDPSKRDAGAIAIPLQRPLQKASYQRRVDLSATPLGTPVAAQSKIHNAPSQLSYKPSPLQLASAIATSTTSGSAASLTSKAAYVRRGTKPEPVKATYERPIGGIVPPPPPKPSKPKKAPGALPLSREEKATSLPRKLALAFPSELDFESALSPHLYSPANLITVGKGAKGPAEGVLHGFWPAPPPRNSGKEVYPTPLVFPGTIAPEDDKRPRVDVFVDNSNVLYSFLNWVRARPEAKVGNFVGMSGGKTKVSKTVTLAGKKVKMDYDVLFAILERGRKVERRILAGSSPLWQSLDASINWGYEVSVLQRVPRAIAPLPQPRAIQSKPTPKSYPPQPPKGAVYPTPNGATYPPPTSGAIYPPPPNHAPQPYQPSTNGPLPSYPPPPNAGFVSADGSQKRTGSRGVGRPRNVDKVGKGGAKRAPPNGQNAAVAIKEAKHYKEQAVDELIHLKILESLLDHTPDPSSPRPLLVLATGDANSSEYNPTGFMGCARRALERGWDVEIIAFPLGTSSSWLGEEARQALEVAEGGEAAKGRGRLTVVNLELFAEELVA